MFLLCTIVLIVFDYKTEICRTNQKLVFIVYNEICAGKYFLKQQKNVRESEEVGVVWDRGI